MKPYRLAPHEKRDIIGGVFSWIWVRRATWFLTPRVCWLYNEKGGGPVLVDEVHWRKISGFQVRAGTWQMFLQWRRWRLGL